MAQPIDPRTPNLIMAADFSALMRANDRFEYARALRSIRLAFGSAAAPRLLWHAMSNASVAPDRVMSASSHRDPRWFRLHPHKCGWISGSCPGSCRWRRDPCRRGRCRLRLRIAPRCTESDLLSAYGRAHVRRPPIVSGGGLFLNHNP